MELIEETFSAELWEYNGKGSWHFITLLVPLSQQIKFFHGGKPGFGSVRLEASIGEVVWKTSVFPDSGRGAYVLPVKAAVRKQACIRKGDTVTVSIRIA